MWFWRLQVVRCSRGVDDTPLLDDLPNYLIMAAQLVYEVLPPGRRRKGGGGEGEEEEEEEEERRRRGRGEGEKEEKGRGRR